MLVEKKNSSKIILKGTNKLNILFSKEICNENNQKRLYRKKESNRSYKSRKKHITKQ